MDSAPIPKSPAQPAAAGGEKAARWRNVSWVVLCGVLIVPVGLAGIIALMSVADFLHLNVDWNKVTGLYTPFATTVILAAVVAWRGIKRGWNTPGVLHNGWILAIALLLFFTLFFAYHRGKRVRLPAVDKAVLNNARQLAAAADQYFLENGVTTCALSDLVGPDKYVKALNLVTQETYPLTYTKEMTITVTGVAGARTVTYAP